MNPFDGYRKIYIAACFAVAVIYAFALGGGLLSLGSSLQGNLQIPSGGSLPVSRGDIPVLSGIEAGLIFCIVGALIYGGILCLTGIILWNIFRFAIPSSYNLRYRFIFISILAVLTCLFIIATESFAIYIFFPSLFDFYTHSIPVRLLITLLIFIIIRLLYVFYNEKNKKTGEVPGEMQEDNVSKSLIDRITVRSGQKIIIIPIDDIIFIKADGDYISINTAKGSWLKEQTMKYTEDTLPADRFVRIHRSYIVNINHISRIERYGEKQQIMLHDNEKIKISAARYQVLKQVLGL